MKKWYMLRKVTSFHTVREVKRRVRTSLAHNGWRIIEKPDPRFFLIDSISAFRDGTTVIIRLSGDDIRLKITEVTDLARSMAGVDAHPAFAYGTALDPAVRARTQDCNAALLAEGDASGLFECISAMPARLVGSLDRVHLDGGLFGWAKLSNGRSKARLEAWLGDAKLGESLADEFRPGLESLGDGKYGYSIRIPPVVEAELLVNQVTIKAFSGAIFLGYLSKSRNLEIY